jgi:hypothetical protein
MDGGFERCKTFDSTFGGQNEFDIAYWHVNDVLASWYHDHLIPRVSLVYGLVG